MTSDSHLQRPKQISQHNGSLCYAIPVKPCQTNLMSPSHSKCISRYRLYQSSHAPTKFHRQHLSYSTYKQLYTLDSSCQEILPDTIAPFTIGFNTHRLHMVSIHAMLLQKIIKIRLRTHLITRFVQDLLSRLKIKIS